MRCICCNSKLPPVRITKTYKVPHINDPAKVTIKHAKEEEDMCGKCLASVRGASYEQEDINDLGLDLPPSINLDY